MGSGSSVIRVEGRDYEVVERLGYQSGCYAVAVRVDGGAERIAIAASVRGPWRWHQVQVVPGGPITGQSRKDEAR